MTRQESHGETFGSQEMERMWEAKTRFEEHLLSLAGVNGVGIGYKTVADKETPQLALVVLVDRKIAKSRLDPRELVPERLTFVSARDGGELSVVTDVQEAPGPIPGSHLTAADRIKLNSKLRPSPGGVRIASSSGGGAAHWAAGLSTMSAGVSCSCPIVTSSVPPQGRW
jgi:hypothetical protein